MFIKAFHISNLVTYFGVISSILGISFAINGEIAKSLLCLIVSGNADLFDGVFARKFARTMQMKELGVQLDSLADVVNFAVFPVAIFLSISKNSEAAIFISCVYTIAAISRLGFFNISVMKEDISVPMSTFTGLPVTYVATFYPIFGLLKYFISESALTIIFMILTSILAFLFILNIKISKPRGKAYIFFILLSIAVSIMIIACEFIWKR